jgi:hypothetical protein
MWASPALRQGAAGSAWTRRRALVLVLGGRQARQPVEQRALSGARSRRRSASAGDPQERRRRSASSARDRAAASGRSCAASALSAESPAACAPGIPARGEAPAHGDSHRGSAAGAARAAAPSVRRSHRRGRPARRRGQARRVAQIDGDERQKAPGPGVAAASAYCIRTAVELNPASRRRRSRRWPLLIWQAPGRQDARDPARIAELLRRAVPPRPSWPSPSPTRRRAR